MKGYLQGISGIIYRLGRPHTRLKGTKTMGLGKRELIMEVLNQHILISNVHQAYTRKEG